MVKAPDPNSVWRVKGSFHLSPEGLAILRELWQWREKEATAANKPPYFILQPDLMISLSMAALEQRPVESLLPKRFSPRRQASILKAIQRGIHATDKPQPVRSVHYRQSAEEKRRYHEFEKRRNKRAQELGLDPTLIASRATLVQLAREGAGPDDDGLMAWQKEVLG